MASELHGKIVIGVTTQANPTKFRLLTCRRNPAGAIMNPSTYCTQNCDCSGVKLCNCEFGKCANKRRLRRTSDSFHTPARRSAKNPIINYRRDFTDTFVTILLLSKSATSASFVLPPHIFPLPLANTASNKLDPHRHAIVHLPRSSPIYFFIDASENNSEDITPIHEFQEENAWEYGNPENFSRQNYVRKIRISDRHKKQLSDSFSFNKQLDDECESYADLNFPRFDVRPTGDEKADFLHGEDPTFDTEAVDLGDAGMGSIASNVVRDTVQSGRMAPTRESSTQDEKSLESSGRDAEHDMITVKNLNDKATVSNIEKKYAARSVIESSNTPPIIEQSVTTTYNMNEPRTRISTEQLKDIKSAISIIDAIETYNLPKFIRINSHTAKACCPFHNDHNPSMSIDENRGIYKCFACGAGGDIFNFVREYDALNGRKEKMGFWEAVQFAATEFGSEHLKAIRKRDPNSKRLSDNICDEATRKIIDIENKKER